MQPILEEWVMVDLKTVATEDYIPYSKWRQQVEAAKYTPELLGLLHTGFHASAKSVAEESERICTYVATADGHVEASARTRGMRAPAEVSAKAFQMLGAHFFDQTPANVLARYQPEVITAVWHFFRPERDGQQGGKLFNLRYQGKSQAEVSAEKFISTLCQDVWAGRFWSSEKRSPLPNEESIALLQASRPFVINIYSVYHRLDRLLPRGDALDMRRWESLDEAVVARLEEISRIQWDCSSSRMYVVGDEVPKGEFSLETAAYLGSTAARTLLIVQSAKKIQAHFEELAAARRAVEEGQRRLTELCQPVA